MTVSVRKRDLDAWREWKRNPNPQTLQAVLNQLNPVIQRAVNQWTGTLARPALELEAKRLAVEALHTYRPTAGAALATHVTNRLKKLSRLSYTHQNLARIPEYQTLKFHSFTGAEADLTDRLGREPTTEELSKELDWSQSAVGAFRKNLRKEFIESGEPPPIFDQNDTGDGLIDYAYYDMSPIQQKIFEHTTGYMGAKELNNTELMKRLNITQGQLSYQKRLMVDKLEKVQSGGKWK